MATHRPDAAPEWLRDAIAVTRDEIGRFVATGVALCTRPRRFAAAWVGGEERALNPLGCMATAMAVTGAVGAFVPGNGDPGALAAVAAATLPYVYYVGLGLLCHPLLRLCGSRQPLRTSVAMALFAAAGPGLVVALNTYLLICVRVALFGGYHQEVLAGLSATTRDAFIVWMFAPLALFPVATALALAGAHALRRRTAGFAMLVAFFVASALLGKAHAHWSFSLGIPHFVLYIGHRGVGPSVHG